MRFTAILTVTIILFTSGLILAQSLPDKIRGYKVYKAEIEISNFSTAPEKIRKSDVILKLLDPQIADVGLFGARIDIGAEITSLEQSGQVDMVSFRDFRVNGLDVQIDDYIHSFPFKKGEPVDLPAPVRVSIRTANIARAAYAELTDKPDQVTLTGTAFVFGKFRKLGFTFKRVVPVKIAIKIKNPLYDLPH